MKGATGVAASGSRKRKQVNSIPNSLPVQKLVKKNVNNSKVTANPVADTSNISHRHLKPISTDNTYNILQDNENEVIVQRNTNDQKKPRIPPIVVQMDKNLIINMLRENGITNYHIKLASIGVYIHFFSVDDFKRTRDILKSQDCKFFTHDLKEETLFRAFLSGLENMDLIDLRAELSHNNINPVDIRILIPKNARYPRHANYILYFKRGYTSLKELQKTRSLFQTIVRWSPFKHFNGRATQCRRCQLPGHGTRNCNFPPRCKNCAESHLTENCPTVVNITQLDNSSSFQFTWKCANCNGPHPADDMNCPSLLNYHNLQRKLPNQRRLQAQEKQQLNLNEFPSLISESYQPSIGIGFSRSYRDALQDQKKFTPRGVAPHYDPETSSDLFSSRECINLFQEMIAGLSQCKNRAEQFQFITACCFKYVYGSTS